MPPDPGDELQAQLSAAFEHFRSALSDALTAEAQRTVDGEIAKLAEVAGPFAVHGAEVEVVVRSVSIGPAAARKAAPRRAGSTSRAGEDSPRRRSPGPSRTTKKKAAANRSNRRGRPDGPVRTAVLGEFDRAPDQELSTVELKQSLEAAGVDTTADNVHQQLRRLVAAGSLERTGRGRYRRLPVATA